MARTCLRSQAGEPIEALRGPRAHGVRLALLLMYWVDEIKAKHRETPDGARYEIAISRARTRVLHGRAPRVTGCDPGLAHLLAVAGRLLAKWTEEGR